MFHTEIGALFQALQYRKDRDGLKDLVQRDERYRHMDIDTLETMSVVLNLPSIWKERRERGEIAKHPAPPWQHDLFHGGAVIGVFNHRYIRNLSKCS